VSSVDCSAHIAPASVMVAATAADSAAPESPGVSTRGQQQRSRVRADAQVLPLLHSLQAGHNDQNRRTFTECKGSRLEGKNPDRSASMNF
jgi:hypothetical protein